MLHNVQYVIGENQKGSALLGLDSRDDHWHLIIESPDRTASSRCQAPTKGWPIEHLATAIKITTPTERCPECFGPVLSVVTIA